jgi:hypothetical protein
VKQAELDDEYSREARQLRIRKIPRFENNSFKNVIVVGFRLLLLRTRCRSFKKATVPKSGRCFFFIEHIFNINTFRSSF